MRDFRVRLPVLCRRSDPELLDRPHEILNDLPANLADIRFLNRWFGGVSLAVGSVDGLAIGLESFSLLDVATGSADIPVALCDWAARTERRIEITALDSNERVLAEAARVTDGHPIRLVRGDARSLQWESGSFDVVTCCLALHHFSRSEAVQALREMWRVCRTGIVITDLTRAYLSYGGTWLVTRTLTRNRVTKHDGPLSVLRSFTPEEMRSLAHECGLKGVVVRRSPMFRQVLVARKGGPATGRT